mgnify:CR=1
MLVADTAFVVLKAIAKRKSLILFMIMNQSRKISLADWLFSVRFLLFEKNWITMAGERAII